MDNSMSEQDGHVVDGSGHNYGFMTIYLHVKAQPGPATSHYRLSARDVALFPS